MILVVSPYHMTSREPAAVVASLLGEVIVAPMPTPSGALTREAVTDAATRVPGYIELMESWEWARPFFAGGLMGTTFAGEDPFDDLPAVRETIEEDDRYSALRPFMRTVLEEESDVVVGAISRDVMKAGPDPAINVPLSAAIDRFSARHALTIVRSAAQSEAQRAEERIARPVLRFAMETLTQAPTHRLLEYRTTFEDELLALREAIGAEDESQARRAADALSRGLERERVELTRTEDPDDLRVIPGMVSVSLVELPVDAVLISGAAAAKRVLGRNEPGVRHDQGGTLRSLVIRPIGGRSPRR